MRHEQFIGQVQHRARMASTGQAERAIRATLVTLGECVDVHSAEHLAAQLPPEIGRHLTGHPFDRAARQEFYERVEQREGVDGRRSRFHASAVLDVLFEAVDQGVMDHVRSQLPPGFNPMDAPAAPEHRAS